MSEIKKIIGELDTEYHQTFLEPQPHLLPTHPDWDGTPPPTLDLDETVPDWVPTEEVNNG